MLITQSHLHRSVTTAVQQLRLRRPLLGEKGKPGVAQIVEPEILEPFHGFAGCPPYPGGTS